MRYLCFALLFISLNTFSQWKTDQKQWVKDHLDANLSVNYDDYKSFANIGFNTLYRSKIKLYFTVYNDSTVGDLFAIISYTGQDWVFMKEVNIKLGTKDHEKEVFSIVPNPDHCSRDVLTGGTVYESAAVFVNESPDLMRFLKSAMDNPRNISLLFRGERISNPFTINGKRFAKYLNSLLGAYKKMGGELEF